MKRAALFVACAGSFLTPFMVSSLNVALASIGKEFDLSAVALSWIPTAYLLAAAVFLVPFGRLADIHGRKMVFLYGVVLYTVACLLLPFSQSAAMLISFRVLEGIGSAAMFGTGTAILTSVYPLGERGKALGINIGFIYAGLSLGPPIGGALTQYMTWRSIFFVNVLVGSVVIAAILWKLKGEWAEARGEKFDMTGSLTYGLALTALIVGLSLLPQLSAVWPVLAGLAGLAFFVFWETRSKSPVLNMQLFRRSPVFAWSSAAALINYSATAAVGFLLSLYLQYIKGFSPQGAGLVLIAQPVLMAVLSPIAGRLSDRIEPRIVASAGMAFTTAGLVTLIFLDQGTGLWLVVLALVLLGLGFGLFSSPNTNAVMSSVEKKFLGVASGTVSTMRLLGQMLSMAVALMLFSLFIGSAHIEPASYPKFISAERTAFIIFAAMCVFGIFASLSRGKMRQ
ncbi:MAG: MFS transporter [Dehalococcoidia bacterium]|nr:MFS transporter [Dehalococcoidia bacterium]